MLIDWQMAISHSSHLKKMQCRKQKSYALMQEEEDFADFTNGPLLGRFDAVGFSDYTRYYEKSKRDKEARLLAEEVQRMSFRRDEPPTVCQKPFQWPKENIKIPLPTQETATSSTLNPSMNSEFSFARGRSIAAIKEHFNSHQSRKPSAELLKQFTTNSNSSSLRANSLPHSRSNFNTPDEYADYPSTLNTNLNSQYHVQQPISKNQDPKKTVGQENKKTNNDMSENVASKPMPMSFLPAGMLTSAKPMERLRNYTQKEEKLRRPVAESIKQCNRSQPAQGLPNLFSTEKVNLIREVPSDSQKSQPSPPVAASGSVLNRRALLLKSALERSKSKCLKKEVIEKSCFPHLPTISPSNDISQQIPPIHENDDMTELLQLASASTEIKSSSSIIKENVPNMLKLSKLAELIEEGRVLVRSDVPHSSTHNFKDFPFDIRIHEVLNSMSFEKPKTIQAYVWEAILRGHNVAFVAGARGGKTLGYLIPILNNLMDLSEYSDVPIGCSPLVVVICSSWENAELVQFYCSRIMKKNSDFRSAVFTDATERSLKVALPYLINGVTLLAATAPALNLLLTKAKDIISFDRCCHLVFDDADVVLKEHGESTKKLFNFYQESVQRATMGNNFIPRQIVACANHWTKGMEEISSKVLKNPSIFISSCMEAAIYGGMKLDVRRGTPEEMDRDLLEIVQSKRFSRTIIFCRGSAEVFKVEQMLSEIGATPILAHNQSIVSDLDFTTERWNHAQPGSAILICTDDVLERLNIKNAQTLIHYFIPHHSKYDFSYRLSFAMDNFHLRASEADRPETHLLITKEFNNSLLTIVRLMQRFGHVVPDELATEAILSFCGKEVRKRSLPLCETLKAFGFCRNMKLCGLRHVILSTLDQPVVPQNGIVRIRITAVRTATQYYARILKHRNEKNQVIDMSGSHFEVSAQLRNHFRDEAQRKNSVDGNKVEIGNIYAHRTTDNLYERVRVESILERDHQGIPIEVTVISIDQGCVMSSFVKDLYEIPDDLKNLAPEAIEVFLVGAKPFDRNSNWSRYSVDFVREKLMSKELEGRIVLALSFTLWLDPLHERKRLDGVNSSVVVTDILKDLLTAELADNNEEHLVKLYHLCETGGIELPNYSFGLAKNKSANPIEPSYAFLPMNEETQVELVTTDSPHQFYVTINKFEDTLRSLEADIKKQISKCKNVTYEDAQLGSFCLVESPSEPGSWCRCCIKKKIVEDDVWKFQVLFVDYGDHTKVPLNAMKSLPNQFISRLPFQAIACSLYGVGPKNDSGGWTEEDICFFTSLTRASDGFMHVWHAQTKFKEAVKDEVTNGSHYHVTLLNREEKEIPSLAQQMISKNYAISLENEEDFRAIVRSSATLMKDIEEKELKDRACESLQQLEYEEELKFDVSPGWIELFPKFPENNEIQAISTSCSSNTDSSGTISTSKKMPTFQQTVGRDHNLALIDHTLPLKENSSRFPTTKWAQSEQDVIITFFVDHVKEYSLELTENHLSFVTDVNGLRYELNTSTYGYIIPEISCHSLVGCGVKVTLRKQEIGAMWTRFIHSPLNQPWLTRDFSYWLDNNVSDDEEKLEPIVDPKYAFDENQSESSSSGSDEECCDEKWLGEDD